MRQLMRHDSFLPVQVNPIRKEKFLLFGIVVASDLLCEQLDDERSELKILWNEAEFFERHFRGVHLCGRGVLVHILNQKALDLCARLRVALDGTQDWQLPELTCLLQNFCGCFDDCGSFGVRRDSGSSRLSL